MYSNTLYTNEHLVPAQFSHKFVFMEGSKPYSLTACLCLFKGDSEGHDVFQVQLIKESIQDNQHHLASYWGHS